MEFKYDIFRLFLSAVVIWLHIVIKNWLEKMLRYDKETGQVHDQDGTFRGDIGINHSEEMLKLLMEWMEADQTEDQSKIREKISILEVAEQPFIVSTPDYCYAYVLYKLRKLSGYSIEEMAFKIGLPKSTYSKIENRFSTVNINTLHIVMHVFGINPVEFAELYWYVQGLVQINGRFSIPEARSVEHMKLVYNMCTPINLYDKKVTKENLNKLELKFQETIVKGKKRLLAQEEYEKQMEEEMDDTL